MPFPLAGLLPAIGKALPAVGTFLGGLFSKPSTVAPAARAIVPAVQRGIQVARPALVRALPTLRRGAGIAGAGAAFEAGSRLVGGQRGISIRVGRDGMRAPRFYRRLNPLNPRALRRAMRRIKGFEKFARKVGYTKRRPLMARAGPARSFSRRRRGDFVDDEVLGE